MANILEFLRSTLTTADANAAFREAPRDHLVESGFADLTGEDVATALAALGPSLSPADAAALAELDASGIAGVARPADGEDELDAAARILGQAVDALPEPAPVAGRRRPKRAPKATAAKASDEVSTDEPTPAPQGPDLSALPTVTALSEALDAAAARATAEAQSLSERIATLFTELDGEIAELRAAAAADVARWRDEAEADREAARAALASIDADAEVLREKAADAAAKIEADARSAAERREQELTERWAELERAEARHQERVANIDTLLKSVLSDDATPDSEGLGVEAAAETPV